MAFGFDDITFSKKELGADAHFVTSILNWILAVAFSLIFIAAFAPGAEAMAAIIPYSALLYFSPLALISVAIWIFTIRKARKFWKPNWIPVIVMMMEYLWLGVVTLWMHTTPHPAN